MNKKKYKISLCFKYTEENKLIFNCSGILKIEARDGKEAFDKAIKICYEEPRLIYEAKLLNVS